MESGFYISSSLLRDIHKIKKQSQLFVCKIVGIFVSLKITPKKRIKGQNRGKFKKIEMSKVQKISELEPTLAFSEFDFYKQYQQSFQNSELGHLHQAIPFTELAKCMGHKDSIKGRNAYFPAEGKLALMFLKAYTNFSDSQLIDNLNSNIHFQFFLRNTDRSISSSNELQDCKCYSI